MSKMIYTHTLHTFTGEEEACLDCKWEKWGMFCHGTKIKYIIEYIMQMQ